MQGAVRVLGATFVAAGVWTMVIGCGSHGSSKSGKSSSSNAAVGKGDAGQPSGQGGGVGVNTDNSGDGCAEDDSLDCAYSTGVTCWGDVYPDPDAYNCSDGIDEGGGYSGYCCD